MSEKRCPDVELIEVVDEDWFDKEPRALAPNLVRIDGIPIFVKKGSVKVRGGTGEVVEVTVTILPGSLVIKQELENA